MCTLLRCPKPGLKVAVNIWKWLYGYTLWNNDWYNVILTYVDPCIMVSPPCVSEADRYSLEALRSIHQVMDDDQDGGIEVEESVEVQKLTLYEMFTPFS